LAAYLLLIQRLVADKQLFVQLMDSNRIQQHCDVFKAMLARTIANGVFQRHASLLISIVHLLSMHLTNHYGIDGWLLGLFKLQLDDNTSIKRVFECARSTTAMSTFTTTTRLMLQRIRHMLGHIDGEEETRAEGEHEQYLVATLKYNKLILESILGYLTKAVTDVEWYMASLPMNDPCLRCLSNALDMLLIISSSVVERATGDHLLRLCTRIYKNVSSISQKLEASNDLVPAVYDTVVKYACLLSRNLYTLVPILQAAESEQMADVPKKKKLKPNVVRVRKSNDGKLMPNLIFYIEQFERYVIMVSKKKRLPFAKHIKRSTARDFRITFDALEEEVEEEEVEV
jgi:Fanconi anemia group I protein